MTGSGSVTGSLLEDELVLHGRIMPASNATFLGEIGDVRVVYKPVAGGATAMGLPARHPRRP